MGGRVGWIRLALGTSILAIALALAGCGAAALPPPPPPTATAVPGATATHAPVATATRAPVAPTATAVVAVNSAQIAAGKAAFTATCGACHTLSAAGTSGTIGPNLNGIGSKRDAAWIVAQIANPCAPGHANAAAGYNCSLMTPKLVSGSQAAAIAAFLAAQK